MCIINLLTAVAHAVLINCIQLWVQNNCCIECIHVSWPVWLAEDFSLLENLYSLFNILIIVMLLSA